MANPPSSAPDTCPGCAARIPPSRPRFCEYCGMTLPSALVAASGDPTAEMARRLADFEAAERAAPRRSGSWGMLIVTVLVVAAVLILGCCAFMGVRTMPGGSAR